MEFYPRNLVLEIIQKENLFIIDLEDASCFTKALPWVLKQLFAYNTSLVTSIKDATLSSLILANLF